MKNSIAKILNGSLIACAVVVSSIDTTVAQQASSNPLVQSGLHNTANINNYTAVYNSGKVFVNWTAKNEANERGCVERHGIVLQLDGQHASCRFCLLPSEENHSRWIAIVFCNRNHSESRFQFRR
jgi:hypothetical protein